MLSANEAKNKAYGLSLFQVAYPSKQIFSIIDVFFPSRKGADPITRAAWILIQEEKRRFIIDLPDFFLLVSELRYCLSNVEEKNEFSIYTESFDSFLLKPPSLKEKIHTETEIRIILRPPKCKVKFIPKDELEAEFEFDNLDLFSEFLFKAHNMWIELLPFFYLDDEWRVIPKGNSLSFFRKNADEESFLISMDDILVLRNKIYENIENEIITFTINSGKVEIEVNELEEAIIRAEEEIYIPYKSLEALLTYGLKKRIPFYPGSYISFDYERSKKLKKLKKEEKLSKLLIKKEANNE